jgi:hypothetical protein
MLHTMKTDVDMFGGTIKIVRRWEGDEATGSKQSAKRSQWAGRLIVNRTRQENDVGKSSDLDEAPRGRNRFKRDIAIRVLSGRLKRDGFESPSTEGQERVNRDYSVLVNPAGRSRGS